jgi:hypothetical protein
VRTDAASSAAEQSLMLAPQAWCMLEDFICSAGSADESLKLLSKVPWLQPQLIVTQIYF